MAPPSELRVKAGVVFWQVKLCDPHLSALEVRFSSHDEALYKSTTFTSYSTDAHEFSNVVTCPLIDN